MCVKHSNSINIIVVSISSSISIISTSISIITSLKIDGWEEMYGFVLW